VDSPTQQIDMPPREQGRQEAKREFLELIKLAITFLLVFWVVKSFIIEGYEVLGESMSPTLEDGDRILVFKLPHELRKLSLFSGIQPFKETDIVVFEGAGRKRLVKRVIAFNPKGNTNKVDAQRLDTGDEDAHLIKVEFDEGIVRVNDWQIDESAYLRESSKKTRDKKVCLLHPGEYYVLGDHRSVSRDSRSFNAISEEQIVGRALVRFWPLSKIKLL